MLSSVFKVDLYIDRTDFFVDWKKVETNGFFLHGKRRLVHRETMITILFSSVRLMSLIGGLFSSREIKTARWLISEDNFMVLSFCFLDPYTVRDNISSVTRSTDGNIYICRQLISMTKNTDDIMQRNCPCNYY